MVIPPVLLCPLLHFLCGHSLPLSDCFVITFPPHSFPRLNWCGGFSMTTFCFCCFVAMSINYSAVLESLHAPFCPFPPFGRVIFLPFAASFVIILPWAFNSVQWILPLFPIQTFKMPVGGKMREVISLHMGQAGVQIGNVSDF